MDAPVDPVPRELVRQLAGELVPHHRAIGSYLVGVEPGTVTLGIDWREDLVVDPGSGSLMGAVLAALLDHCAGLAVLTRFGMHSVGSAATLDMRVDYLKPTERGKTVHARTECYALSRDVAYVRGEAFHPDGPPGALATAAITYVLTGSAPPAHRAR
jgi:acyl-coenzyme A thioesterase PaaI-like protein